MSEYYDFRNPGDNWKERLALAFEQTGDAEERLAMQPHNVLRWPWANLDELTGPLGLGGAIWFLVAVSGSGKTTFVLSLIELLRLAGKKCYVMPLETSTKQFRAALACMTLAGLPEQERLVIDPGDINSGAFTTFPNSEQIRHRLTAVYKAQRESPYLDQVMISGDRAIDVPKLRKAFDQAYSFGADLMIVDHIDHIAGEGGHIAEQTKDVCHTALDLAEESGITVLFTSQINFDMLKSPDKLAKYQPPQIQHMKYPTTKVEVATGIIGLSRQIRTRGPYESEEEYGNAVKGARADEKLAAEMLVPGVTQVNAMKLRNYGSRTGMRTLLGYEHGRIIDLPEKDRYQTGMGGTLRRVA